MNWERIRYRLRERAYGTIDATRLEGVKIGEGCRIYSRILTSESWLISIGDRVTISTEVAFVTHDGSGWLLTDARGRRYKYAGIEIGSDVFVGTRSIVMPGVRIGNRCIVGAGSVVTKSVPDGHIVAGNPAIIVGTWDKHMEKLAAWSAEIDKVGSTYADRVNSIKDKGFKPEITRRIDQ